MNLLKCTTLSRKQQYAVLKHISVFKITLLSLMLFPTKLLSNQVCSPQAVPKYHLLEKCHRSKLGIIAKANFSSFTSCQRLGIEKKGLALNFSPPEIGAEYSCEVLKCAESDGGQSLVNDTAFDYYSIYARPIPNINSTCVPGIGMFYLQSKHMNYSEANAECKNMSSTLADVTNEQRTDAIAQLLAGAGVEAVFTGLRRHNSSVFVGDNGYILDCTTFRAWAPGHPRKNYTRFDCALVTRKRTWISTPCKKQFPVLCELTPGGPYKKGAIFKSRRRMRNDTTTDSPHNSVKANYRLIYKNS